MSFIIELGSSDLGLSEVNITLELRSEQILPIIERLSLSLSPPQPITVIRF